jgi:hypothetical protein
MPRSPYYRALLSAAGIGGVVAQRIKQWGAF